MQHATKKAYAAPRLTAHGNAVAQTQAGPYGSRAEYLGYKPVWSP